MKQPHARLTFFYVVASCTTDEAERLVPTNVLPPRRTLSGHIKRDTGRNQDYWTKPPSKGKYISDPSVVTLMCILSEGK